MNGTRPSTTEVRDYQPDDLLDLLEMGARFAAAAGERHDPDRLHALLNASLGVRHDGAAVRVWVGTLDGRPVGFLVGAIGHLWMTGEPVAHELAWWVDLEARATTRIGILLLDAFTRWGQEVAPLASCSTLADLDPRVERLLKRKGWHRAEVAWTRRWQPSLPLQSPP
jgi:hypothetical protein